MFIIQDFHLYNNIAINTKRMFTLK